MLRVAADVTPLLTPRTGIGVFVGEMLGHLAARDDLDLTGYAVSWRGRDRLAGAVPPGMTVATRPMAARPLHEVWRRTDHPLVDRWIGRHQVVWGTNYVVPPTRAAALVSVYDLTTLRFPELATAHTRTFPDLVRRAVRRGASIHTMSEHVRGEILDSFDVPPDRVHVVPGGVRPGGARSDGVGETGGGESAVAGLARNPYILALGTVEPRKDLPTLVAAFDLLAADLPDLRLVIAGPDGWGAAALAEAIDRSRHAGRVVRIGWVDEADRPPLLAGAAAYAFPSVYEGFGFPPLEAMAAGAPVVASDAGSLPEVCGDGAALVPAGDAEALAGALRDVLTDAERRDELVRRGRENVARYTWESAAAAFAALFADLGR